MYNLNSSSLKKTKKSRDINNINFDKIKKIINLPNSKSETLKYLTFKRSK